MTEFNDRFLKGLIPPESGNRIWYDDQVKGLGLRITAGGAKSFVFNYRIRGRERRYTIGPYGKDQWTLLRARRRAGELRRMVERGEDPLGERQDARNAPTVAELCDRFEEEHIPRKRPRTQADYKRVIAKDIRPELGAKKVAEVTFADMDALHRKITRRGAPYEANRVVRIASKMFNLAVKWRMRPDNPTKGIELNSEERRERYIDPEKELPALIKALAEHADQQAADIIRLLLLTGARRGEVQAMRWDQLNLGNGTWTKLSAHTKQKKPHHAVLSAAAVRLLKKLRTEAEATAAANGETVSDWVFPSRGVTGHRVEIKKDWRAICKAAGITRTSMVRNTNGELRPIVKHGARIHDLRHSYASILASAGLSLPIIGALLGHTQPATTARYSHLFSNPLRRATEHVAAIVGDTGAGAIGPRKRA
ncbi:MAG TPA: tyrosine-type recombinase/integrase [Hyphomicrobiaceae bacterium]|nr:tyrosine-type recombinase/integrase [Hyphomicrobiaceae bacterium]